jgi:hypothetical protein
LVTSLALLQHKPFKDGDPHTTLWEGNEVAVRLILETGRLNVLLRCCVVAGVELKQYVRAPAAGTMLTQPTQTSAWSARTSCVASCVATCVARRSDGDARSRC